MGARRLEPFQSEHRAVPIKLYGCEAEGKPALATLLANARQTTIRIFAVESPFDRKDLLKGRGYRWSNGTNGCRRCWWRDVAERDLKRPNSSSRAQASSCGRSICRRGASPRANSTRRPCQLNGAATHICGPICRHCARRLPRVDVLRSPLGTKMSKDDFDDDGLACPPRPLHPRSKRLKIHRHSQHTVVELDGPHGPIRIESSTTVTFEAVEDDLPPYRFDNGFAQQSLRRLPKARKRRESFPRPRRRTAQLSAEG